ncbi:hypothetical protein AK973_6036 [Pseudomonas brassicacearum]|nr:hypothetical protein AK973_6036 [Pseudomonas brassicacearum]
MLQPFWGLALVTTLLDEHISRGMLGMAVTMIVYVAGAK